MTAKSSEKGMIKAREAGDASASPMQRNAEQAFRSRLQPIRNLHRQTLRSRSLRTPAFRPLLCFVRT